MSSSGLAPESPGASLVSEFTEALLSGDDSAPGAFVRATLRAGVRPEVILEQVFTPAAQQLGALWESDDCSFYEVTIASGHIQRLVRAISPLFLANSATHGSMGRMLLTCASGEQHSLGTMVIAEYFIRDGWDVHLMTIYEADILLDMVRRSDYDCLAVSVACDQHVPGLCRDIRRARQVSRNPDIRILVGGQLLSADRKKVQLLGADGFAADAESAVAEARRLCDVARAVG